MSNQRQTAFTETIPWVLVTCVLLSGPSLVSPNSVHADEPTIPLQLQALAASQREAGENVRRVNAPYNVPTEEAAILWFGRVTPTENSADARVLYRDDYLYVRVVMLDRRLWYDTSPSPDALTKWDAVTLYLDTNGNVDGAPEENAYRFDAQLNWWENTRDNWQAAFRGDGTGWVGATIPFTTASSWRGDAPNDEENDRGWTLTFKIPFDSLGLDGPPPQGDVWGMALVVHDRDDATGTPIADQLWPETTNPLQPATWGQLAFGLPTYDPVPAIPEGTVTIRHGLNGAVVADADVGGSSVCGEEAKPDFFSTWGTLNYAGKAFSNIQNQSDVADWPCFSKYYVTFPLDALPDHKSIVSATLTLYQLGNAGEGWDPGPQPSLIQILSIGEDWDESTITWNNAPLALENVSTAWTYPLDPVPEWPGVPREWDVSLAAAQAYAAGEPLRLALYEADWAIQSGKYFVTSDTDEWGQFARPTLRITWGTPFGGLEKSAAPTSGNCGDRILHTLNFWSTGGLLTLTDTLPIGVTAPQDIAWEGTSVKPSYDSAQHRLTWSEQLPEGQQVTIRYAVNITAEDTEVLVSPAELHDSNGAASYASTSILANPMPTFLPMVRKR